MTLPDLYTFQEVEEAYLTRVIAACEGDVTLAAKVSGIPRATLYRKVKKLGLRTSGNRTSERREKLLRELRESRERQALHQGRSTLQPPESPPRPPGGTAMGQLETPARASR